jgi:molybdopterin-binding protein
MLSARNQFKGRIKEVKLGQVMAEIVIKVGDLEVVSLISRTSAERMGLKVGDQATAVVKATEVMVDKS